MATRLPSHAPAVAAAIDVGSNSVHLFVGMVTPHAVSPLADESTMLGLGAIVDTAGRLPFASRSALLETLRGYAATAARWQARELVILGTEPMRRTADRDEVAAAVLGQVGCPLDVLSHAEEGELTLLGVTGGRVVTERLLVVDIGGGSTEYVEVEPGQPPLAGALQTGSDRLTAALEPHDPPTDAERRVLLAAARTQVVTAPAARPSRAVFTGGTATNLAKLRAWRDGGPLPTMLSRAGIEDLAAALGGLTAERLVREGRFSPTRARLLPAGAALVLAFMERFELASIEISPASLREGAVLAVVHGGATWRSELSRLTLGWQS